VRVPVVAIYPSHSVEQPPYRSEVAFSERRSFEFRCTLELKSEFPRQLAQPTSRPPMGRLFLDINRL
jgi:hypothetical protein